MIPFTLPDENDFIFSATLDGVVFKLWFQWNERAKHWVLGLQDANGVPMVLGVKLVPSFPLMRVHRTPSTPAGEFVVISKSTAAPGRLDFVNGLAMFCYVLESELG